MADMYGPVMSNVFAVNYAERFRSWIAEYSFGGHDDIVAADVEPATDEKPATMMLHGSQHYGHVWPVQRATDEDDDPVEKEVDMDALADEFRTHLADGEVFYLIAIGPEGHRYAAYEELAVSHTGWGVRVACSDAKEDAERLIAGTTKATA